MITFAAGPSKVYESMPDYLQDAYREGILSANHRSAAFMSLYQEVCRLFQEKLHVPESYQLLFTSSATENWEIITQSIVERASFHIYSGSFGKKWINFAQHILPESEGLKLAPDETLDVPALEIAEKFDLIALTQNETSNATQVRRKYLEKIREKYPEKLLAIDSTSSMGGLALDFSLGDIWYASIQKCFGLPAGLGLLILSPRAIAKAEQKGESGRYNSLSFMLENARGFQTHYTPNVLGIYLLKRVLEDMPEIQHVDARLRGRMANLEQCIVDTQRLRLLVFNEETRSTTVLGVSGPEELITEVKAAAAREGMQVGSGYGPLKPTSFRIANFPAISDQELTTLMDFLKRY